ncbi:hypothetical protein KAR91_44315 [Candidatus Pacearchaeota archaeon]|nr:hypothetical protein [Candidatus Pacearchaeota archaeon]
MPSVQENPPGYYKIVIRKAVASALGLKQGDNIEFSKIDGEQITAKPGDYVLRRL